MLPRLSTWLVVALAGGALISGCGGSESTASVKTASTGLSSTPTNTAGAPTRTTTLPSTATLPATAPASPTTTSSTRSTPLPTTTAPSTTGTKTVPKAVLRPPNKISGKQAVTVCKGAVHAQPTLSSSTKAKLEKSCEKAAAGGQSALDRVAHEVCLEIINTSGVPAGATRERALATCSEE